MFLYYIFKLKSLGMLFKLNQCNVFVNMELTYKKNIFITLSLHTIQSKIHHK